MSKKNSDNQSTVRIFIRNFLHNPSGVIGLTIISVLMISSIFAVQISGVEPDYIDPINSRLGPSLDHLMGTDQLGRDMFSVFCQVHDNQFILVSLPHSWLTSSELY